MKYAQNKACQQASDCKLKLTLLASESRPQITWLEFSILVKYLTEGFGHNNRLSTFYEKSILIHN